MDNQENRPATSNGDAVATATGPRRRRGWILWGACGLVLLAAAGIVSMMTDAEGTSLASEATAARRPVVTVASAERGSIDRVLALTGTVIPREEIAIGAAVDGQRIAEVKVEEGDRVVAGQVILRLETDLLAAAVRDAEANVLRGEAAVARDQATQAESAANFQRIERLRGSAAFNAQEYDKRKSAALTADKALEVSRAELAQARAKADEARSRLDRAEIRAPTDGIVAERAARVGAMAGSEPLIKLIRQGEVELEAEVPEADLPMLAEGQDAHVTITGVDTALDGRVRLVAPKADRDSRLGRARITLPDDPRLRPGVFGRAAVVVERRDGAVTIPDRAVMYRNDKGEASVLAVADDGLLSRRPVTVGLRRDGRAEILSGLAQGERVVLGAGPFLRDGDRVAVAGAMAPLFGNGSAGR